MKIYDMKNIFLLFICLLGIECFSQSITVNTNTHTIPELVTDVLVNKACVPVSNITWRTGNTNGYGSSNGIGYFENTNPSFPLKSGVILSTGNVLNSPGPNTSTLNDGNTTWTGDSDLEVTLLSSGITMKSANASVLEFDFIPFSSNFDFKFLFASEEYGNFQCQFSDAFAFLLTNKTTGITTNLAVVPGTTSPISVVTIHDFLYNSSCPSANPNYFGVFNGGSMAASSATNFNGQTVVMNASSTTLIPNTPYHIKLVIADRQDNQADSAIFLGSNSFNVGQDVLGPDLTIANKTAICDATNYTIDSGLDPTIYSFAWTYNNTPIGSNTPNITIDKAGVYGLSYAIKSSGCTVTTDFITVEYYPAATTPDPIDLYKCDSGQANFTFDLSINTPIVNKPGTQITYHYTLIDAKANKYPLGNSFTIEKLGLPATIYIQILDTETKCETTKSFQLRLTPPPVAFNPGDISLCESSSGSNTASFDISLQTSKILGSQSASIYSVAYYSNPTDANAGTNPISTNFSSGNATVFARIENKTDTTCFTTISFKLNVIPLPLIDEFKNQFVCTSYVLPNFDKPAEYYSGTNKTLPKLNPGDIIDTDKTIYVYADTAGIPSCPTEKSFTVKIVKPIDIILNPITACDQYTLPIMPYGTRYFTQAGGLSGGGTELYGNSTSINTAGVNTIYTYFVSTDVNPCIIENKFDVTIDITPKIVDTFTNIFDCVSYDLRPLSVGNYYTFNDFSGTYTPAISPITTTTKLYVFAENNSCRTPVIIFTAYIGKVGLADINQCQSYDLPAAPIGEYRDAPNGGGNIINPGNISKSTTIYTYVPQAGTPNCTNTDFFTITINQPFLTSPTSVTQCESYLLPNQIEGADYYTLAGGPSTIGNVQLLANVDAITNTTTVYIYKPSTTITGCYNEKPWLITINKKPKIDSRADIVQCDDYVLTPLENGNYYSNPNGINPLAAGTIISDKYKRIYIYAANPNDAFCYSENFFDITVNSAKADPIPTLLTYCDSFTFPSLPSNKNYYYDAPRGPAGGGNIIPFGTTITKATALPMYYVYYETGDRLNCSDEKSFKITIADKPVANPVKTIEECDTFGINDGVFQFDLTASNIRNQVLGSQSPDSAFTLSFYNSLADANTINATSIVNPEKYQNINPLNDTIWIRVANNTIPNPCFEVVALKLKVNLLPKINLNSEYFICQDFATGTLLNPATLNTSLSTSNYDFEWTLDGNPYGGNTASITTSQNGIYVVKATDKTTFCTSSVETKISTYNPHIEITYSEAFEEPTFVSINVLGNGSGNYEYQLDDSNYQESNTFNNIIPGQHTISVKDKNGNCNPAPLNTVIINYPKYFTPNGDGYNETWNIKHLLNTNPNAQITVFDRYGKLITKITPSSEGWNGLLNGNALPSNDYWFTVDYSEKGISKTFKSHFTLKR